MTTLTTDLREDLDRHHVKYGIIDHRRTMSAREEARAVGVPPEEVAKTIVLTTDDGYIRAVVAASDFVDLYKVRALFPDGDVRLATEAELIAAYPMYELGAVPPFDLPAGDRVLVDRRLAERKDVVLEAGSHDESFRMKRSDLVALADARVGDISRGTRRPPARRSFLHRLAHPFSRSRTFRVQ